MRPEAIRTLAKYGNISALEARHQEIDAQLRELRSQSSHDWASARFFEASSREPSRAGTSSSGLRVARRCCKPALALGLGVALLLGAALLAKWTLDRLENALA
jgi:hypothetical protein